MTDILPDLVLLGALLIARFVFRKNVITFYCPQWLLTYLEPRDLTTRVTILGVEEL
jgi:hypothetical protein